MKQRIFVSSVQEELAEERRAVRDLVRDDPLLGRFFEVFLREDLPARKRRAGEGTPDTIDLREVERAALYVGLFGDEYGAEQEGSMSPTELEFERASERGKARLVFVKGGARATRHPQLRALLEKAGAQLARRRFDDVGQLIRELRAGLVEHLLHSGAIATLPFDAAACPEATLEDLSPEKIRWFLGAARRERKYALEETVPIEVVLTHLNLLDHGAPSRAAVLLFARAPQRFLPNSRLQCTHVQGTARRKASPPGQIFEGTLFDLVDQTLDCVLARLGSEHQLPRPVIAEALANALAHRDYTSDASVQVTLFADRLEVRSPGELPSSLMLADLGRAHASIPRNPLLSEPLFLARYSERIGTGTLDMLAQCRAAALPAPEFRQERGEFVVTLWRLRATARATATPAKKKLPAKRRAKPLPKQSAQRRSGTRPKAQVKPSTTRRAKKRPKKK